jgi:hypothetical protein
MCAEPIKLNARKCVHCESYQDWFSNLGLSATILSLLVALLSVLSTTVPVLKDALTPKNSKLIFSVQGADDKYVSVLASNEGLRAGSVQAAGVHVKGKPIGPLFMGEPKQLAAQIVEAGKSVLIDFHTRPILEDVGRVEDCAVSVHATNFDGTSAAKLVPVDCSKILLFIQTHRRGASPSSPK